MAPGSPGGRLKMLQRPIIWAGKFALAAAAGEVSAPALHLLRLKQYDLIALRVRARSAADRALSSPLAARARRSWPPRRGSTPAARRRPATCHLRPGSPVR